jgi:hypothetical protein
MEDIISSLMLMRPSISSSVLIPVDAPHSVVKGGFPLKTSYAQATCSFIIFIKHAFISVTEDEAQLALPGFTVLLSGLISGVFLAQRSNTEMIPEEPTTTQKSPFSLHATALPTLVTLGMLSILCAFRLFQGFPVAYFSSQAPRFASISMAAANVSVLKEETLLVATLSSIGVWLSKRCVSDFPDFFV